MGGRWGNLIVRLVIAALLAWTFATTSLPFLAASKWFAYVQVPVVIFVFLCYTGKLLIDTFFYNHYKP